MKQLILIIALSFFYSVSFAQVEGVEVEKPKEEEKKEDKKEKTMRKKYHSLIVFSLVEILVLVLGDGHLWIFHRW